jgi:hypothetical protein
MKISRTVITPALLVFFLLVIGCGGFNDLMVRRTLRPETAKEYQVKGTLLYFTTDIDEESTVNGIIVMFRNAPDFYAPVNGGFEGYALDVPTNCTGISRIGLRYSDLGSAKEYWLLDSYSFTVGTNRVNYLGRFVFQLPLAYDMKLGMRVSNVTAKDKARFAESYTNQTNLKFTFVDIKNDGGK